MPLPAEHEPEDADTKRAMARMVSQCEAAREDVDAFIEFIGEGPGGVRMRQESVHRSWQQLWSGHRRSVLLAPVGHGKTTQLRHRLLWMIGRNPNIQIAYVSATERHPKKVVRAFKAEIELNPRVAMVFPHLKSGDIWTSTEFTVVRTTRDPDPTLQIFGAFSQSVLGSRADVVVFDDLCNGSNTLTEYALERMDEWVGEVISRLKPSAQVMAIGHIWNDHDQLQRWSRLKGWAYQRDEATTKAEGEEPHRSGDRTFVEGEDIPLAPRVMTLANIIEKSEELGPVRTEMMLYNRLASKSLGRFRQAWFDRCLQRGRGLGFAPSIVGIPAYTGVDLGHRKAAGSDLTVLFTAGVLPDGSRQILDIRSGRWSGPEILHQIKLVSHAFGSTIAVENNGAQQHLLEFAEELECIPIRPHTTTAANKHDVANGVDSLGIELSQGKWIIPCSEHMEPNEETMAWINGCLVYDPTRHASDFLMACWIARECIRLAPATGALEIQPLDLLTR